MNQNQQATTSPGFAQMCLKVNTYSLAQLMGAKQIEAQLEIHATNHLHFIIHSSNHPSSLLVLFNFPTYFKEAYIIHATLLAVHDSIAVSIVAIITLPTVIITPLSDVYLEESSSLSFV